MEVKFCKKCQKPKTVDQFPLYKGKIAAPCKECRNLRQQERRKDNKNPEFVKQKEIDKLRKIENESNQIRECNVCHKEKSFAEFHNCGGSIGYRCKNCSISETVQWGKDNPKKRAQQRRRQKQNNPERYLIEYAKARAKRNNLEFNIVISDIIIPKVCPVLGIPIVVGTDDNKTNSPSLDRIDNNKGYTKENIIVISYRANQLKGNSSQEERELLANFYKTKTS